MRARKQTERVDAIKCIPGDLQIEGIFQRYMKHVVERITLQEIEKKIGEKKWRVAHLGLQGVCNDWGFSCLVAKMS